jgi:hypothetical protein
MVKTCTRQGLIVAALAVATGLAVQAQRGRDGARDDAEDNKALAARFKDFKPVTDAILEKPDPPTGFTGDARSTRGATAR